MLVFTALLQEVLNGMNLSILRIFRILRVARVARVMRVVRFFTQLLRMLLSIFACTDPPCWAFLLLVMIMFIFSVTFVQGATVHIEDNPTDTAMSEEIERWYGSMDTAMFSLLYGIT